MTAEPPASVFDAFEPPDPARMDECVHCGFCLPTCPTYQLWAEEMDSPRGRIYLLQLGAAGEVEMDDTFVGHFDACLGCMACVTACPSGVAYDELIEAARGQIERRYDRDPDDRRFRALLFSVFPHPRRLRVAAAALWLARRAGLEPAVRRAGWYERLPDRWRALHDLAPDVTRRGLARRLPERVAARGVQRARVALLTGCVQSVFFSEVNAATARVLASEGCEVVIPRGLGCCGALEVHSGRRDDARARARALVGQLEAAAVDHVVVNAAGCGSSIKDYDRLFAEEPDFHGRAAAIASSARDVSELLVELGPAAPRHPVDVRVAYHDACHLAHAQGIRSQPRTLLREIPGVELLELSEPELCCGSAGIYNLVEPEAAAALGRRKAATVSAVAPDVVATGNPGCLLQLRRHLAESDPSVRLLHPIQILDASIRG